MKSMQSISFLLPLFFCLPASAQTPAVSGLAQHVSALDVRMPCRKLPKAWIENHPQFQVQNPDDDEDNCNRGNPEPQPLPPLGPCLDDGGCEPKLPPQNPCWWDDCRGNERRNLFPDGMHLDSIRKLGPADIGQVLDRVFDGSAFNSKETTVFVAAVDRTPVYTAVAGRDAAFGRLDGTSVTSMPVHRHNAFIPSLKPRMILAEYADGDANPREHTGEITGALSGAIAGGVAGPAGAVGGAVAGAIAGFVHDIERKEDQDDASYRRGNDDTRRDRQERNSRDDD